MPRLLILSQYFPPEMGAPQARLSELAERLIDRGWEVEALTALPNYPTGRVFSGYGRWRVAVETVGRVRTVRVPLLAANRGFVRRLASYFSFVAAARFWGPRHCPRPDVLFVESPPLFIGYGARSLARRWRCPYVFNVSDLWPESAVRMGVVKTPTLIRLAEHLELSFYRSAAAVTGQSSETIESIRRRCPGLRTAVITNGVEPARFGAQHADDEARQLLGSEPGPIFLYAGLLGLAQGLDQILDVATRLPPEVAGRTVLVGDGPCRDHLEKRLANESIERVRLLPAQPRARIPALLAAADAAIISLGSNLPGAVPSKIYEAMAAALPILIIADGEAARRVTDGGAGLAVPPGDLDAITAAWTRLASDAALRQQLGTAGRHQAETVYDREQIAGRLDALLREIVEA